MKAYKGTRTSKGVVVTVEVVNSESIRTYDLLHQVKHSPTGFEMGYCGSGPSDLARCILLDMGFPIDEIDRCYHNFKLDFISRYKDEFILYEDTILTWWDQRHHRTNE